MLEYLISKENKYDEKERIMTIAQNNKFSRNWVDRVINTMQISNYNATMCSTPQNKKKSHLQCGKIGLPCHQAVQKTECRDFL
jgi:hypothetical protein